MSVARGFKGNQLRAAYFRQVSPESIVEKVREMGANHEKIKPSRPNASTP